MYGSPFVSYSRPLQRMVVGMFLGSLAFVVAGIVQLQVQVSLDNLTPGEAKVVFTNTFPDTLQLQLGQDFNTTLAYGQVHYRSPKQECHGIRCLKFNPYCFVYVTGLSLSC